MLGGINETGFLSSVELFNWQSGEQCHLPDLPYPVYGHVGTVLDGVPVFCGGDNGLIQYKCFKLNLTDLTWNRVSFRFSTSVTLKRFHGTPSELIKATKKYLSFCTAGNLQFLKWTNQLFYYVKDFLLN